MRVLDGCDGVNPHERVTIIHHSRKAIYRFLATKTMV